MGWQGMISYLTGYVEILIRGRHGEKLINMATFSGLYLWDLQRLGPEIIHGKIRAHGFFRLREMAKRTGCRLKIHGKHGWPFLRRKLAERRMFIVGAVLFLGTLYYLSSLVLVIRIDGLQSEAADKLTASLKVAGLTPGMTRGQLLDRKRAIEREMMLITPEAVWLGISVKGVVAEVKVVPRKTAPLPAGPCDIVADSDGVVAKVVVIRGEALVKEGDIVAQGDLLIQGIRWYNDLETGEMRHDVLTAAGIVEARVWRDIEVVEPKMIWQATVNLKPRVQYSLRKGERFWTMAQFGPAPGKNYFWERRRKRIYQGRNLDQTVELIKDIYYPVSWRKRRRSPEEVRQAALAEAELKRKQWLIEQPVVRSNVQWTDEGQFVRLLMTLETTRNIAKTVPPLKGAE